MKGLFIASALLAGMLMGVSCDKYEDGRPAKPVRDDFNTAYPDARDVEWERQGQYWVVSFETGPIQNGTDHEVWYDLSGAWVMSMTEVSLADVPQNIKDYLAADPVYGKAMFEDYDAEYIEKPSGSFYRFDMRLDGREVDVDVTPDGEVAAAKYGI